ncbi:MAG: BamA/TamA family outer membrane protein, partial [Leptolyngbya sp. SIO3F4]|nr:BamA/TamA family outer membrane protein [Leptolyngbya sp. SIO3F4]
YLFNHGYFNNTVSSQVEYLRRKRARVTYTMQAGRPYLLDDVRYSLEDYTLLDAVSKATKGTLLKPGQNFDLDKIDEERVRVTKAMRNQGYYDFTKEFLIYEADTTNEPFRVDIKELVENPTEFRTTAQGNDTIVETKHLAYTIRNVYVNAAYSTRYENFLEDTLQAFGIVFTNQSQMRHNPKILAKSIFVKAGDLYRQEAQEYTYRRLSALQNFKYISINYEKIEGTQELNCFINLSPSLGQSFAVEGEGTNTGGNLGVSGNLNYAHKNLFKGTELLAVKLFGGVEAQQTINSEVTGESSEGEQINIAGVNIFNTFEYGAETSLNISELLIPKKIYTFKIPKYDNPKTIFAVQYNFQNRPDYARQLSNASIAYRWSASNTKNSNDYSFYPINFSVIRIEKDTAFERRLEEINNPFYTSAYDDHLILGVKFDHAWSNQKTRGNDNFIYNRASLETSGNGLSMLMGVLGEERDDQGSYQLFNIRYAQYLRLANDIRLYRKLNQDARIVYRAYAGIGLPYGNLDVMPLNRSFFAGGANDIRAWNARSLGPGSLTDIQKQGIDQVGDILIEGNIEYRYRFTKTFEGALFTDVGNIWLLDREDQDEEAEFQLDRFYNELAVGSGIGFRFDFSFLLLRFDWGFQIKDPALPEGERWIFQSKDQYNAENASDYRLRSTFNLGIGYPF